MTKFRCIKGSIDVPVGTIIEGELEGKHIRLIEDSAVKDGNNNPFFQKGETVLLTGYVWQWESCTNMEKLLEHFEKAVRAHEMSGAQDPEDRPGIEEEYESAKAELLKRLS